MMNDTAALDAIAAILSKPEWSGADDLDAIAAKVKETGRSIEPMDVDELVERMRSACRRFDGYHGDDEGYYRDPDGRKCDATDVIDAACDAVALMQELDKHMTDTEEIPVVWQ